MTTRHYALPVETTQWFVEGTTETAFNWEYDEPRDRLLTLYEKGKRKQWDGQTHAACKLAISRRPAGDCRLPALD